MRGQAFVTLDTKEAAAKAVKEVQQFPLYGKPMVSPSFPLDLSILPFCILRSNLTNSPVL
jgi:hypothetical protein